MNSKIGVLCTYRFPEGMAPTIRILSYSKGLIENQCDVEVVIFQPQIEKSNAPSEGVVDGVRYTYSHVRNPNSLSLYKVFIDRPKALINAVIKLYKSNKEKRFDCLLLSFDKPSYLVFYAVILKLLGFKLGFIGDEFPEPIRRLKEHITPYYKWMYKFAYLFISFRILMTTALQVFYDREICYKPTYILCSILNASRFDHIIKSHSISNVLCYMGNMMLAKDNVDNIIRAFNLVKDDFPCLELHLYGTPSEKDETVLLSLIQSLNLSHRVFLKGRINYAQVPQTLSDATILVTSQPKTLRAAGGFPTKLAEYMMSKTPAIVTDVGEIKKYVKDGDTIYMVPPSDEVAYSNKIRYILNNLEEARSVAERAYAYATENFGAKNATKPLLDFIVNVAK